MKKILIVLAALLVLSGCERVRETRESRTARS